MTRESKRAAGTLFLAAIAFYAPFVGWALPDAAGPERVKTAAPDEIVPLEALAEMHNTFVVSKWNRNYGYPWFHYFVTAAFQAPYVGYLYLSGQWDSPSSEYPYGFRDPVKAVRTLGVVGRLSSVLLSAGTVAAAYFLGLWTFGAPAGALAAGLTMLSYPLLYYSHTVNLEAPLLFWCTLGALAFADIVRRGLDVKRGVGIGVLAALAIATKDQGVLFFAPLGAALLLRSANGAAKDRPYPWKELAAGLGSSIMAYAAAAGMFIDPRRHITHVRLLLFDSERIASEPVYSINHDASTWAGLSALLRDTVSALSDVTSPFELALVAVGIGVLARRSPQLLALLLPIAAFFLLLTVPTGLAIRRYLLPGLVPLTLAAAVGLLAVYKRAPAVAVAIGVLTFGWKATVGADLLYRTTNDSRYAAAAWLEENVEPGDWVEHFSSPEAKPNLPSHAKTRWVAGLTFQNGVVTRGPQILEYLHRDGPRFVLLTPDWTSGPEAETSFDCPPEVFEALQDGSLGYKLVAYFPRTRLLPDWFPTPRLDTQAVSPPIRVFERRG